MCCRQLYHFPMNDAKGTADFEAAAAAEAASAGAEGIGLLPVRRTSLKDITAARRKALQWGEGVGGCTQGNLIQ